MIGQGVMKAFYEKFRCRLCNTQQGTGAPALAPSVLSLPATPLANSFCKTAKEARELPTYPLDIMQCKHCGHHQLGAVVDPGAMFTDYAYASGTSESFRKPFAEYAAEIRRRYPAAQNFLEVGSNDGTMLRAIL